MNLFLLISIALILVGFLSILGANPVEEAPPPDGPPEEESPDLLNNDSSALSTLL